MKYLIISGIALVIIVLVSKVIMAVNFNNYDMYMTKTKSKLHTISTHQLEETGKTTYLVYCSSCHGANGKGNDAKAHNHTKRISKESVLYAINNGANNFSSIYPSGMPAGLVGKKDAKKIALFVANGMKGSKPKTWKVCASCHNESGEGIPFVAPNINNYSNELISTVLKNGKKGAIGTMPNFKDRLSYSQICALATYIRSIGEK